METVKVKVIFRKWRNGDILALFPQLAASVSGDTCESYEHVGQHGGADYHHCIRKTTPANAEEYADLEAELQKRGYDLIIAKRASYKDAEIRRNS